MGTTKLLLLDSLLQEIVDLDRLQDGLLAGKLSFHKGNL